LERQLGLTRYPSLPYSEGAAAPRSMLPAIPVTAPPASLPPPNLG
jgi:hypothetical protein